MCSKKWIVFLKNDFGNCLFRKYKMTYEIICSGSMKALRSLTITLLWHWEEQNFLYEQGIWGFSKYLKVHKEAAQKAVMQPRILELRIVIERPNLQHLNYLWNVLIFEVFLVWEQQTGKISCRRSSSPKAVRVTALFNALRTL